MWTQTDREARSAPDHQPVAPRGDSALREEYGRGLQTAVRGSGLVAGAIALVAFPAWSVFDRILLPERAASFFTVRMLFEALIAVAVVLLCYPKFGRRHPKACTFFILALPEIAIAWMVPRSEPHLEAYLLGFTLAIYASAFVVVWRWQLTVLLSMVTVLSTIVCIEMAPRSLSGVQIGVVAFYLGTAAIIAVAGQLYRYHAGWRQFVTQRALEVAKARNDELVAKLERLSLEDDLSGLANRRAWDRWLESAAASARRGRAPLSVILCDVDRLKEVNDEFGHAVGDSVIRTASALLTSRLRITDFVGRLGGDEFVIGCAGVTSEHALLLAEELAALARTTRWPFGADVTFSMGVAGLRATDAAATEMVERADQALYAAKLARNRVCSADRPAPASRPWPTGSVRTES